MTTPLAAVKSTLILIPPVSPETLASTFVLFVALLVPLPVTAIEAGVMHPIYRSVSVQSI